MLVEIELQILVRVVNAQLFQAVLREILEAEYIEDRDSRRLFCAFVDYVVDTSD